MKEIAFKLAHTQYMLNGYARVFSSGKYNLALDYVSIIIIEFFSYLKT